MDATFNPGTGATSSGFLWALAAQPDGKIIVGGSFGAVDGTPRGGVARLNADGSLDASFLNSGSGVDEFGALDAVALQGDGKIVIGGGFDTYNGTQRRNVARLNADGSLDASFLNSLTGASSRAHAITLQPDGKIILGGAFTSVNGTARNRLARLNSDGSLDNSFLGSGSGPDASVRTSVILSDGKVLIGGSFFSVNGTPRGKLARLDSSGNLDATFIRDGGFTNAAVIAMTLQPDGKILIGGGFSLVNGTPRNSLARLNADGSLDASFFGPSSGTKLGVEAIVLQPDGKVLVGGPFNDFNGEPRRKVVRLNADGSLDNSFVSSIQGGTTVRAIAVQADGKVLVGGIFTLAGNQQRINIARLNANGFLDSSFPVNFFGSNSVEAIVIQPDGKILVGGNRITVTSGNGPSRNVVRLNADGSLDTSFTADVLGGGFSVQAIALQPDGKVLIGGSFSSVNGVPRFGIARLSVGLAPNPIDTPANFVTQHYRDFLNREPDAAGLAFWTDQITQCGADAQCAEVRRVNVSAAFYLSIEFQETGYLVYRAHQSSFNTGPTLRRNDFLTHKQTIGAGVVVGVGNWTQQLEQNKQAYFAAFVDRPTFLDRYPTTMAAAQFVDALNANTLDPLNPSGGGSLSQAERDALVSGLTSGAMSRAQVFRAVAEDPDFNRREFNRAFVLMQYFGYLKRNPNDLPDKNFDGYNFWLQKLNHFDGNFVQAEMVKAFISSIEYRDRFGS